ncbi:hypothetical protein MalM25_27340 [Planctomycetes bacterium MalM25]|nr:hypothetical protein MalM25_27340 [Planctomycetes bacterium MalM25]
MTRRIPLRPLCLRALTARRQAHGLKIPAARGGLTLVEMLVAMAITLLIMGAVVTVFANISSSVTRRRATIEMSSALRNVRETLARDLAGATCPAIPWQRAESNHGYLEIIEGPQNDYYPTPWLWDVDDDGLPEPIGANPANPSDPPRLDLAISTLPGSNLEIDPLDDLEGRGRAIGSNAPLPEEIRTDGRGLGDADDILMLTVRNEKQPFVGRIPPRSGVTPATPGGTIQAWRTDANNTSSPNFESVESPLAEVVWFAVENPVDPQRTFAFGEPGFRTIHRRALLILPELDYGIRVTAGGVGANGVPAGPGVVRVLPASIDRTDVSVALAGLIAFQDRYDLSVRVEWDAKLPGTDNGRWVLRANSLGDLTRRENRYEHHGYVFAPTTLIPPAGNGNTPARDRYFPFAVASAGLGNTAAIDFRSDRDLGEPSESAEFGAIVVSNQIVGYQPTDDEILSEDRRYASRPLVRLVSPTNAPATARAILDEDGHVVHVTRGMAPLGGARRGDDIMMTEALAFDLRVYDPGAPLYSVLVDGPDPGTTLSPQDDRDQILDPGDPAWGTAYLHDLSDANNLLGDPTLNTNYPYLFERQGAYVDLGYAARRFVNNTGQLPAAYRFAGIAITAAPQTSPNASVDPRFETNGLIYLPSDPASPLTTAFAAYDTWSSHYESDGVNQDRDDTDGLLLTDGASNGVSRADEGVNGLDDPSGYDDNNDGVVETLDTRYGPDDLAERETRPPYDSALRGMQVTLRAYERDSRQIREVNLRESFVPE